MDVDTHPGEQTYYRLRQIDFNGQFHFSEIVAIKQVKENNLSVTHIRTVEAIDQFYISLHSKKSAKLKYALKDWRGHVLKTDQKRLNEGLNNLSIDLSGLPSAIYYLELKAKKETELLTFRKIDGLSSKDIDKLAIKKK